MKISSPTLEEAMNMLAPECKLNYVYTSLMVMDAVDGQVAELEQAAVEAGVYRHKVKRCIMEMKRLMSNYKYVFYRSIDVDGRVGEKLVNVLDALADEYDRDVALLHVNISQCLLNSLPDTTCVTVLARASVIDVLTQYIMINDAKVSKGVSKVLMRDVSVGDDRVRKLCHYARAIVDELDRQHKEWYVDLNSADSIRVAFEAFDRHVVKVVEVVKGV